MKSPVALQPKSEGRAVWGGRQKRLVRIGDQQNQVCGLKKIGLVANGVGFGTRALANSGGIQQPNHQAIDQPLLFQMISSCSGNIINQGELSVGQRVEQRAFAGIGWSEDGHRGGTQRASSSPSARTKTINCQDLQLGQP